MLDIIHWNKRERERDTYENFHISIETIVQQKIVCHLDPVWLHWMTLTIIVVANVAIIKVYNASLVTSVHCFFLILVEKNCARDGEMLFIQ